MTNIVAPFGRNTLALVFTAFAVKISGKIEPRTERIEVDS